MANSIEGRINQRLDSFVITAIEEIIHAPLHEMLAICSRKITEIFDTGYACIHFTKELGLPEDDALPALKYCPMASMSGEEQGYFLAIEDELNDLAVRSGTLIHEPGLPINNWPEFMSNFGFKTGLTFPLTYQDEIFGVVDIYHKKDINFTDINFKPLVALGSCLYGAVKKEVIIKSLQERDDVIEAFARTIEASDRYTGGHVDRVCSYAMIIGKALNLDVEQLKSLRRAALLHDVGKIGVPDSILNKEGSLSPEEWEIMKHHPVIAGAIFGPVRDTALKSALDGILYHHERIDGKGYPFGLSGEGIPLQARIIAIADTYDALTSDRPYRKGMSKQEAADVLRECRGTQLDALLVDLFLENVSKGQTQL